MPGVAQQDQGEVCIWLERIGNGDRPAAEPGRFTMRCQIPAGDRRGKAPPGPAAPQPDRRSSLFDPGQIQVHATRQPHPVVALSRAIQADGPPDIRPYTRCLAPSQAAHRDRPTPAQRHLRIEVSD